MADGAVGQYKLRYLSCKGTCTRSATSSTDYETWRLYNQAAGDKHRADLQGTWQTGDVNRPRPKQTGREMLRETLTNSGGEAAGLSPSFLNRLPSREA